MSMMVYFLMSFFPRSVLDEIFLNLIESVSEGFPSYFPKYFQRDILKSMFLFIFLYLSEIDTVNVG